MEFKGTKEEWNAMAQITQGYWIETEKPLPTLVCRIHGTNEEAGANAKLIAAAPDLLEALQQIVMDFEEEKEVMQSSINKASKSIKKALK